MTVSTAAASKGWEDGMKRRRDEGAMLERNERAYLGKAIDTVVNNPDLNPSNVSYVKRIQEKFLANKRLTANEVAGLSKIERALTHKAKAAEAVRVAAAKAADAVRLAETKAALDAAKPIGG